MKITVRLIAILIAIAAGIIFVGIFRGGGKWEVVVFSEGSNLALAIGHSGKNYGRTVIFQGTSAEGIDRQRFVFPNDHEEFHHGQVTFADYTLLPGRVTLMVHGVEIDVMQRALIVAGTEYSWSESGPIVVRSGPEQIVGDNAIYASGVKR